MADENIQYLPVDDKFTIVEPKSKETIVFSDTSNFKQVDKLNQPQNDDIDD